MLNDFVQGIRFAIRGFSLINQSGIRGYVLVPLLINVVLFSIAIWYGYSVINEFINYLLPPWLDWLKWLLWPVFALSALLVVFYTFTLVANLIAAPFNSVLAQKLERKLSSETFTTHSSTLAVLSGMGTAMANEVKKLLYLLLWAIPLMVLFLIPGINLAAPFLWFVFGAWMLSLEYADYPMANYDLKFRDERALLRQHTSLAMGFGSVIMLMTAVPVLNFLSMPVGVAGATAMWVGRLRAPANALTSEYQAMEPDK